MATYNKTVGLDAQISTVDMRITQAVRQVVTRSDAELFRVTQAARQVVAQADSGTFRITQAIRQVVHIAESPYAPTITGISGHTATGVNLTFSAYYHPGGETHDKTRVQLQLAGAGSFTSLLQDNWLGAVELYSVISLSALTTYEVRIAYIDDEGDQGAWSPTFLFATTNEPADSVDFDWDDWAQMWNIGAAAYGVPGATSYIGPGGWSGPIDFQFFAAYTGCYDIATGNLSAGYSLDTQYNGKVGSFGRLMGPPSVLANTAVGANNGVNVAGKVSWYSGQWGYSWNLWWDCELARNGVAALVCGTCEPVDPSYGWDVWGLYQPEGWPKTAVYQGVVAYIEPGFSWPYVPCACWEPTGIAEIYNWLLMTCDHYSIGTGPMLVVEIWHDGERKKYYSYNLPWDVTFADVWPRCVQHGASGELAPTWECQHAPWYGVRLKVEHDLVADATGKTHNIQATCTTPETTHYESGNDPVHITKTGDWGKGEAALPGASGPWLIDEVWVGGNEELVPGDGKGGLYCGWSGWVSDRWTGAIPDKLTGGNIYKDFTAQVLSTLQCSSPCAASKLPEIPPEYPEPPERDFFLTPCPPDQETADKELYLGEKGDGDVYQFGGYEVEEGRQIEARIRPNPLSPAGVGGVCLFKSLMVVVEHFSDIQISIVPILNGEYLDQYAQEEIFIGQGDRQTLHRYEMPLYREFEDQTVEGTADDRFTNGLRGTYFTFEMTIVDLCGIGLQLPGVWLDYEEVREDHNTGVVYTEDMMRVPAFAATGNVYLGTKGYNRLLKAETGVTDDGIVVEAKAFSNPIAPEGEAGECLFKTFSLTVNRWNEAAMDLIAIPYVDGKEAPPITINFKATTSPVQEVVEIDLAQAYQASGASAVEKFTRGFRGAWFHLELKTGSGLQKWLGIDGGDIYYDVLRESVQKDVR